MEQLSSHWTDFHENLYLRIFWKSGKKIQVSLKLDKNKGYFTWQPSTFFTMHYLFLLRMIKVSDKSCRENQNTHFVLSNFFVFNHAVYDNVEKYFGVGGGHRWQYGTLASHAGYLRLQIYILSLCYTHYFSTATMVARTPLNVDFIRTLPVLSRVFFFNYYY